MKIDWFVSLFISSHQHISCNRTCCKNAHEMNLKIITLLFTDCLQQTRQVILCSDCTEEKFQMLVQYVQTNRHTPIVKKPSLLTLNACFTRAQMEMLTQITKHNNLFATSEDDDLTVILQSILDCDTSTKVQVNSIKNTAVLFDALATNKLVCSHWQSVLEKSAILLSPNTGQALTSSSFSSSLSKQRKSPDAAYYSIKASVQKILTIV